MQPTQVSQKINFLLAKLKLIIIKVRKKKMMVIKNKKNNSNQLGFN